MGRSRTPPLAQTMSDTAYEPQRERLTPGGGRAIPTISPRSGLFGPHFEAMALGLAQAGAQVLALAAREGTEVGAVAAEAPRIHPLDCYPLLAASQPSHMPYHHGVSRRASTVPEKVASPNDT